MTAPTETERVAPDDLMTEKEFAAACRSRMDALLAQMARAGMSFPDSVRQSQLLIYKEQTAISLEYGKRVS